MRKTWLIFSQTVTVAVAVLFVVSTFKPQWIQAVSWRQVMPGATVAVAPSTPSVSRMPASPVMGFRDAAQKAAPTVVSVVTSNSAAHNPRRNDPWFRYFFGDQEGQPQSGIGSGVIVSPEGYVLTNNHVVERMDDIEVMLTDGRKATAKVIGTDPDTDLAVLKIDLDRLPSITLGDSDSLQVGDAVLAIGNPFGVGQTVTMGIISATGRNQLGLNTYEDFIQTDAAINPGNSGGALVDALGNLIGINTAIFSKSGGSQGIGFAIPSKLALEVMNAIIEHGRVIRGWLGIEVQPLTPELAESFGLEGRPGIVVAAIYRNSPAERANLQPGDIILSIDGQPASDGRKSMNLVAQAKPGEEVSIAIVRNGQALELRTEIGLRPPVSNSENK